MEDAASSVQTMLRAANKAKKYAARRLLWQLNAKKRATTSGHSMQVEPKGKRKFFTPRTKVIHTNARITL